MPVTTLTEANFHQFLKGSTITGVNGAQEKAVGSLVAIDCKDCKGPSIKAEDVARLKDAVDTIAADPAYEDYAVGYIDCGLADNAKFCSNTFMQYPTVGLMLEGDQAPLTMPGSVTAQRIGEFINSKGHMSLYDPSVHTNVTVLNTADEFKATVLDAAAQGKSVLVEFYADWCPHCQKLVDEFDSAAGALKTTSKVAGNVEVVAVNCANDNAGLEKLCAEYKIAGYPTLQLFKPGFVAGTDTPVDFSHQVRPDVATITTFVETGGDLSSIPVPEPEAAPVENFHYHNIENVEGAEQFAAVVQGAGETEDVLVQFYADWCGHCQRYRETFDKLAQEMKDKHPGLKVVAVNCNAGNNQALCDSEEVMGFPTFKLYTGAAGAKASHVHERGHPQDYDGWKPFLESHGADSGAKEALEFRLESLEKALEDLPNQLKAKMENLDASKAALDEAKMALTDKAADLEKELQDEITKLEADYTAKYGPRTEEATEEQQLGENTTPPENILNDNTSGTSVAEESAEADTELLACSCGKAEEDAAYVDDSADFDLVGEEQLAFAALVEEDIAC
eukprot:tig00000145_g8793.t1